MRAEDGEAALQDASVAIEKDILDNIDAFEEASDQPAIESGDGKIPETVDDRYAVNLLIDHSRDNHPDVVLEPSPSYDNLFGQIQYRPMGGGMPMGGMGGPPMGGMGGGMPMGGGMGGGMPMGGMGGMPPMGGMGMNPGMGGPRPF